MSTVDPSELLEPDFEGERKARRERRDRRELRALLEHALRENDRLERDKELLLGLSDRKNAIAWARPKKITKGQATAMLVMTDLHIGEVVRPETVLGLNEFNHTVAEKRIKEAFSRFTPLLDKERSLAKIEEGIVYLGGDLIGGKIHSDQAEVNDLGLVTSGEMAEEWLERGLRTIVKEAGLKRITVVCLSGNHDRGTHKVQHSSFYENSYASTVYLHLRRRLSDVPSLQFVIGAGEYEDLRVYNWNIRFTHGHRVRFSGGVGGLSIPWNKHVAKLNKAIHADFTVAGHLHTFTHSSEGGFLVNGSIIGTTAYSLPFGHQEPCQGFVVIDKNRCVTVAQKVFCQ